MSQSVELRQADVIHAHYAFPFGLAAVRLGRKLGKPVVLTLRGSDVNVFPDHDSRSRARFSEAVLGADVVLAVSGSLAHRTEHLTGRLPVVLPTGVRTAQFANLPTREHARALLGLDLKRFTVLYVGNLLPTKGVHELLEALNSTDLRGTTALFVGDGPLRGVIAGRPNTVAVGTVTHENVGAYLAAADVLVLPSHREGTPNVIVEAGAAGLPVVATTVGGIPALLEDDRGWLVPPREVRLLSEAVAFVRDHPEEARQRARSLRDFVYRKHDAAVNARQLSRIYFELLGKEQPRPWVRGGAHLQASGHGHQA